MADIKHLKADASQEDIFSVIDQDAALILDDVLDNDLLNQIKDELDPYLNNYIKGKTELKEEFLAESRHLLVQWGCEETCVDKYTSEMKFKDALYKCECPAGYKEGNTATEMDEINLDAKPAAKPAAPAKKPAATETDAEKKAH